MPEELTQTVDSPSAPQAPAASAPPAEPSAPSTNVVQPPAPNGSAQPQTQAPATPADKTEWDGNLESLKDLPKDQVEHAKSVRRYLTKEREKDAQRNADLKAKAEQFERIQNDPALAEFQRWKQNQVYPSNGAPAQQPQQPLWNEAEWAEAQINPNKMAELVQRGIQAGVRQQIGQYAPIVQQMQQKQAFIERSQEVQDFAQLHPDLWDLYDAGIMRPLVQSIVDTGKGSIAEAYDQAKKIESFYKQNALKESQGRILEKKNAVAAQPSTPNEPSIIWANDREEAKRIAYENAVLGKSVNVRVKKT